MDSSDIPEFGEKEAGCAYRMRPGAYAVLLDARRQIAVVKTRLGYFLPGGGAAPGETPEETLYREVREECGYAVRISRRLGEAIEYVCAPEEGLYFQKQSLFFEAQIGDHVGKSAEDHHELLWMTPAEAAEKLTHRSQAWAVGKAIDLDEASSPGCTGG